MVDKNSTTLNQLHALLITCQDIWVRCSFELQIMKSAFQSKRQALKSWLHFSVQTFDKVVVRGAKAKLNPQALALSRAFKCQLNTVHVHKLTKTDEAAMRLHIGEEVALISISYAALYVVGSYLMCSVTTRSLQFMPSKRWPSLQRNTLNYAQFYST